MKLLAVMLLSMFSAGLQCQNDVRLFNTEGKVFKVIIHEKVYNKNAQAEVLVENLKKDTVLLKLEFENAQRYGVTIYLLEKGKPCSGKEFNYRVELLNNRIKLSYTGIYDVKSLPGPIVPKLVQASSQPKSKTLADTVIEKKPTGTKNCVTVSDSISVSGFLEKLRTQDSDGARIQILKREGVNFCLNKEQVIFLLKAFIHDREKLDAAKMLYYSCNQKENYVSIIEVFTHDQYLPELQNFLKNQGR